MTEIIRPPPDQSAVPVAIVGTTEPVPVIIANDLRGPRAEHIQRQSVDPSIPARTTFQEDLTFAGQRRINLIWEYTQAVIALLVVVATMISGITSMFYGKEIPNIIGVAFGMVTGFYFSRTNHAAIGGVGHKPDTTTYQGR
jgi:hypothetical protein